jgi:hypothetical protein
MPYQVNGIGTWPCVAGYDIGTGNDDGIECFTVFGLPLVPYRAVHLYGRRGNISQVLPIRWSPALVFRAMTRPWLAMVLMIGAGLLLIFGMVCLMHLAGWAGPGQPGFLKNMALLTLLGFGLTLLALAALLGLGFASRRTRQIRTLLASTGRDSDPVTWLPDTLAKVPPAKAFSNCQSYAAAVEPFLAQGEFGRAMWAARLAVVLENKDEGERLTELILGHPGIAPALHKVSLIGSTEIDPLKTPAPPFGHS